MRTLNKWNWRAVDVDETVLGGTFTTAGGSLTHILNGNTEDRYLATLETNLTKKFWDIDERGSSFVEILDVLDFVTDVCVRYELLSEKDQYTHQHLTFSTAQSPTFSVAKTAPAREAMRAIEVARVMLMEDVVVDEKRRSYWCVSYFAATAIFANMNCLFISI